MNNTINANFLPYEVKTRGAKVEVLLKNDNLWLTQDGLAELFGVDEGVIAKYLGNVFDEDDIDKKEACAVFAQAEYYSLDVILAVGYRVNHNKMTEFRNWAIKQL